MASKIIKEEILAKFYDEGVYTSLFANGAVSAACGYANGQQSYVVYQNGEAVTVKDVEKNIKVLEMAAQTGSPVVTFYNSVGAKLEEGLEVLAASAKLNATIAKVSGVVPQIAVVVGVCGATSAISATNADLCIMSEDAELFFTAPFTSGANGDKTELGTLDAAKKAGVVGIGTKTAEEAAEKAAHVVGLLPANNLAVSSVFAHEEPAVAYKKGASTAEIAAALVDKDSAVAIFACRETSTYHALATINGDTVGVVVTGKEICDRSATKTARFVRLCDAFSVPVVTVIDTEGFKQTGKNDLAGGIRQAARLTATYADATTAKIAVFAGSVVGPVYTALASADIKIAVPGCVVSAVCPKVAVSVLYKSEIEASDNIQTATNAKAAEYSASVCSAQNAVESGVADMVCDAQNLRGALVASMEILANKRAVRLPKKHANMAL